MTGGVGVDAALECVGTDQSMPTAFAVARPGLHRRHRRRAARRAPVRSNVFRNVGWRGGPAPARIYLPELLDDVLAGTIDPGRVFDYETDLDHVADAYTAMNDRRAIKSLIRVGSL